MGPQRSPLSRVIIVDIGVRRLAVVNGPNIFQMLLVVTVSVRLSVRVTFYGYSYGTIGCGLLRLHSHNHSLAIIQVNLISQVLSLLSGPTRLLVTTSSSAR